MEIKHITIGIQMYGYQIDITYYGFVDTNKSALTFYPLGKRISYGIQDIDYVGYVEIPIFIYYNIDNTIKMTNEKIFNRLLESIINQINKIGLPLYKINGIQIEYIDQRPLINPDNRITTLVNDQSPKQDRLRVLYDTADQLVHPNVNAKIIYRCNDGKNNVYIGQIKTNMYFLYNGDYFIFYNDTIGDFKYNIFTGHFIMNLKNRIRNNIISEYEKSFPDNFKYNVYDGLTELEDRGPYRKFVMDEYTSNYPDMDNKININIVSLELDVNFMLNMG